MVGQRPFGPPTLALRVLATRQDALAGLRLAVVPLRYLAAIVAAELLTALVSPRLGILLHVGLLFLLLGHGALASPPRQRALLLALTIAPLTRILSLALPLGDIPRVYWYALVSLPLAAAGVVIARTIGYSRRQLGVVVCWRRLPLNLLIVPLGGVFGLLQYLALRPPPLVGTLTFEQVWLPALILALAGGLVEEFLFRGVLQRAAVDLLGSRWGLIYGSLIFASLYAGYQSLPATAIGLGVGGVFALVAYRTGSLVGVALAPAAAGIGFLLIWPIVVPALFGGG